jgi:hypothetical protein
MNPKPKKLLERVRETIRRKHYSQKTEQAYVNWIKQDTFSQQKTGQRGQQADLNTPGTTHAEGCVATIE